MLYVYGANYVSFNDCLFRLIVQNENNKNKMNSNEFEEAILVMMVSWAIYF